MKITVVKIFSVVVLMFCVMQAALSQGFRNIYIDSVGVPSSAVVAVNAKDSKNIVAGMHSNALFVSSDEGQTWSTSRFSPKASARSNASLVSDYKGNFYLFYLADSMGNEKIVMQTSEDGGKTWTFTEGPKTNGTQKFKHVSAFVDYKNNLYLTWTQFDNSSDECHSQILFSKSTNRGKKWSNPLTLSLHTGNCNDDSKTLSSSSCALVGTEKTFVSWIDDNNILVDRSYDGKMWLSNDIVVTSKYNSKMTIDGFNNGGGQLVFLSDNGKSIYGGSLYVVATKMQESNDADILFLRSTNGGDNWMTSGKFSDDEPGAAQFNPAMAIDQETGYLYVIYYTQLHQNRQETDVYIAYSKDGGASFNRMKINTQPFVPARNMVTGNYTGISVSKGVIIPVWMEMDKEKVFIKSVVLHTNDLFKK